MQRSFLINYTFEAMQILSPSADAEAAAASSSSSSHASASSVANRHVQSGPPPRKRTFGGRLCELLANGPGLDAIGLASGMVPLGLQSQNAREEDDVVSSDDESEDEGRVPTRAAPPLRASELTVGKPLVVGVRAEELLQRVVYAEESGNDAVGNGNDSDESEWKSMPGFGDFASMTSNWDDDLDDDDAGKRGRAAALSIAVSTTAAVSPAAAAAVRKGSKTKGSGGPAEAEAKGPKATTAVNSKAARSSSSSKARRKEEASSSSSLAADTSALEEAADRETATLHSQSVRKRSHSQSQSQSQSQSHAAIVEDGRSDAVVKRAETAPKSAAKSSVKSSEKSSQTKPKGAATNANANVNAASRGDDAGDERLAPTPNAKAKTLLRSGAKATNSPSAALFAVVGAEEEEEEEEPTMTPRQLSFSPSPDPVPSDSLLEELSAPALRPEKKSKTRSAIIQHSTAPATDRDDAAIATTSTAVVPRAHASASAAAVETKRNKAPGGKKSFRTPQQPKTSDVRTPIVSNSTNTSTSKRSLTAARARVPSDN